MTRVWQAVGAWSFAKGEYEGAALEMWTGTFGGLGEIMPLRLPFVNAPQVGQLTLVHAIQILVNTSGGRLPIL